MKSKYYIIPALIVLSFILTKCANIVPVTGGPKDEKEPILKKSSPKVGTANFKGGKVLFEFNEEIEVDNNPSNIIVSPIIEGDIKLKVKNKKYLEVSIPNTLEANTTYSININNAVKDITEGNTLKNVSYAFSTGEHLDSLSLNGKIINAENKKPIENTLIGLYKISDTLNISKQKPLYISYSKKDGSYTLNYLKEGTYYLLAINDKNKNLSYNNGEQVAYINDFKISPESKNTLLLELTVNDTIGNKLLSKKTSQNIQVLSYKNGIKEYQFTTIDKNTKIHITQNRKKSKELIVFPETYTGDSIKYIINTTDSLSNNRIDTITMMISSNKRIKNLVGKLYLETQDFIPGNKTIVFASNKPITKINIDSIFINKLNNKAFELNFNKNLDTLKITLQENIQDTTSINFKKGSLITYDGDTLDNCNFTILKADISNYSSLEMIMKTKEENYLIQLLSEDYTVLEEYKNITNLKYNYIKPGKYRIRAIIDTNNNNYWDCGNVLKNEQPEKIIYFNNDLINLKPNWELKDLMFIF